MSFGDHLLVLNQFLGKADAKDKLTATIQYACMFLSAGQPGNIKKIQASVTAARKIFRVLKPLESLTPVILHPEFPGKQPFAVEALVKAKHLLMALYFAADHVVWAGQIGLPVSPGFAQQAQRASLWGWCLGSMSTGIIELYAISQLPTERGEDETEEEWSKRQVAVRKELNQRLTIVVHCTLQAMLAAGLMGYTNWSTRRIGLIGTLCSLLNCYMLYPPAPRKQIKLA